MFTVAQRATCCEHALQVLVPMLRHYPCKPSCVQQGNARCILNIRVSVLTSMCTDVTPAAGSLLFTQLLLSGWVEGKRWADLKNPGSQGDGSFLGITGGFKPVSNGYPGMFFGECAKQANRISHDICRPAVPDISVVKHNQPCICCMTCSTGIRAPTTAVYNL